MEKSTEAAALKAKERHEYTCALLEENIRLEDDSIAELTLLSERWMARYAPLVKKAREHRAEWIRQLENEKDRYSKEVHG